MSPDANLSLVAVGKRVCQGGTCRPNVTEIQCFPASQLVARFFRETHNEKREISVLPLEKMRSAADYKIVGAGKRKHVGGGLSFEIEFPHQHWPDFPAPGQTMEPMVRTGGGSGGGGLMQVYKLAFHGTKYSITVNVQDDVLTIEVEQEEAPHARWCGEFTSTYVEDITSKVGACTHKRNTW